MSKDFLEKVWTVSDGPLPAAEGEDDLAVVKRVKSVAVMRGPLLGVRTKM
jgi:hypothetical protein